MGLGELLKELIHIADIAKTDFALHMYMTPSGLSKILSGQRIPTLKEKTNFCYRAASYFANAIYSRSCYLKFENIFPIIYDFNSQYELEQFLENAIEYHLDNDLSIYNGVDLDYSEKGKCFIGKKMILDMYCVIASDYIIREETIPSEFYGNLSISDPYFEDIFERVKIYSSKKMKNVVFNNFLDASFFDGDRDEYLLDIVTIITDMQKHVRIDLWEISKPIENPFMLLKGEFLIYLTEGIDGIPIMTVIQYKSFVTIFLNRLMKDNVKKMSYTRNEVLEYMDNNPTIISEIDQKKITAVYNFIFLGYLISDEEVPVDKPLGLIRKSMFELMNRVLVETPSFYMASEALKNYYSKGKVVVPLLGEVEIPLEGRLAHLQRFTPYINDNSAKKVKIVMNEVPEMVVLCFEDFGILYTYDSQTKYEKIHLLKTKRLHEIMDKRYKKNISFSDDLWEMFLKDLDKKRKK